MQVVAEESPLTPLVVQVPTLAITDKYQKISLNGPFLDKYETISLNGPFFGQVLTQNILESFYGPVLPK